MPSLAVTDLTGVTVLGVTPRGKHQLFRFDNGWTLHTHFRMEGAWRTYPSGRRWSGGPDHEIRAVLSTAATDAVGYRVPVWSSCCRRRTKTGWWVISGRICSGPLGIEERCGGFRAEPDVRREALLDQRNLAGLGTFYRSELLFLQGLHPRTPVSAVAALPRVVQRAHLLLNANKVRAEQSTTGDLRQGRRTYVFERPVQPCRRCGTSIRTEEFGPVGRERRSYWCPRCQPER